MIDETFSLRKIWNDYKSEMIFGLVLPLNRSYLSQLINSEYGCSFYHWVNGLRIEEAKRLMREQPDLKIQDLAERCGFASRQVFARETGVNPREWK